MMRSYVWVLTGLIYFSSKVVNVFPIVRDDDNRNCSTTHFQCGDKKCIPLDARCNGIDDCADSSDETDCDNFHCIQPHFFRCGDNRCIASIFVCDKDYDCEDFSDEINCEKDSATHKSSNTTCAEGEWQCTDRLCIPEDWVCNQEIDCLDGSDEGVGCSIRHPNCLGFRCANQRCIPQKWQCDGHDDCSDNSDELDCEHHFIEEDCTVEKRKFLCHDRKACIDLTEACDSKDNCMDKSDEGLLCNHSAAICEHHGCSHECVPLPTGPQCLCPVGYHMVDDKTCVDINECEIYGICDQKCRNTQGSYECYCDHKYVLQEDMRTCQANGGEATLIFSSQSEIRSYLLTSDLLFPIASDLKQVVGVSSDGHHIYWTDVHSEHESIVRASEDGSNIELLVTSGLGLPEDLQIDYLTGNIYFTDIQEQHIGVCKNDGNHCTVLIDTNIRKPRAIALHVDKGVMFWTDWENPAQIVTAEMDGQNVTPFLTDDIHWPNGLAIDYPNSRMYWTDAKKMTLESVLLDRTDRRVILKDVVKHPFSIAVFENKLYWSDWGTHSIDSCDKFSGKNHRVILKESHKYIYGINIYHSALHKRIDNPCALAFCSDICLLNAKSYSCACSEGRVLGEDKHTCVNVAMKQMLLIAAGNVLLNVEHRKLGRQSVIRLPSVVREAGAMAYDSRNHSILISDLKANKIVQLNLTSGVGSVLPVNGLGKVISMDYDCVGNNLFICDSSKKTLEVISLYTNAKKVLLHNENEVPHSVALLPHEGLMFVSLFNKEKDQSYIDKMFMDGTGHTHVIVQDLLGPVILHYDAHYGRVFFADVSTGIIEHTSIDGDDRHFLKHVHSTVSSITTWKMDFLWTNEHSNLLFWMDKSTAEKRQKMLIDIPVEGYNAHIISITPQTEVNSSCLNNNGNCSHICLPSRKAVICACPNELTLADNGFECIERNDCGKDELGNSKCQKQNDCSTGKDKGNCTEVIRCPLGYFTCKDGQCILEKYLCDHNFDCKDQSDEQQCHLKIRSDKQCLIHQMKCGDGTCINQRYVCDGVADCSDNSDETNCLITKCSEAEFRCNTGECIPRTWECDYEHDCSDFSDEHSSCEVMNCTSQMFTCDNRKCVDKGIVCDGQDDCGDGSDERTCLSRKANSCGDNQFACNSNYTFCIDHQDKCNGIEDCPNGDDEKNCPNCGPGYFECKDGKCISVLWTCDGMKDCGDGSDENMKMCESKSDKSITTSRVPKVTCQHNHRLMEDGYTCMPINQCEEDMCSQLCHNTDDGFLCSCYEEFQLRSDKMSCKSTGEPMSIIYTVENQIRQVDQKTNSLRILFSENMSKIMDFDVSMISNAIIFTIENSPAIHKLYTDTMRRVYIEHIGYPRKVAYDWSTGHVYFYNAHSEGKSINVCSFEAMTCAKLIDLHTRGYVANLVVDPINKVLFYTIITWWSFNSPSYILYRASLDGSGLFELVESNKGYISGLAFDFNKRKLFYTDQFRGEILKLEYDGSNQTVIFSNLTRPSNLRFFEDTLYFSASNQKILKCSLYGSKSCEQLKIPVHNFDSFIISQQNLQKKVDDPCSPNDCRYMCVASGSTYKCLCGDDNENCTEIITSTMKKGQIIYDNGNQINNGKPVESSRTVVSLTITSLFIIILGAALIIYARSRHTENISISMKYYNPTYGKKCDDLEKPIFIPGLHEYTNPMPQHIKDQANTSIENDHSVHLIDM